MATFLDALADLVSDPSARAEYGHDPARWLAAHQAGDLCAEDVRAAAPILCRWFPDAALAAPGHEPPGAPSARGDLDAAITEIDRLLAALPPAGEPDDAVHDTPDGVDPAIDGP